MKKILLLSLFLVCLQSCAIMPPYSNLDNDKQSDISSYTILETETFAGQPQRYWADGKPNLEIIRINEDKVGNIPFSSYYYKGESPQRALLKPGHYTVQLEYKVIARFLFADFEFEAKPGQKILARSKYVGLNMLVLWLEDATTHEKIGKQIQ
jgi:hypothetical protein